MSFVRIASPLHSPTTIKLNKYRVKKKRKGDGLAALASSTLPCRPFHNLLTVTHSSLKSTVVHILQFLGWVTHKTITTLFLTKPISLSSPFPPSSGNLWRRGFGFCNADGEVGCVGGRGRVEVGVTQTVALSTTHQPLQCGLQIR